MCGHVVVEQGTKPFGQLVIVAAHRRDVLAIDVDGAVGRLTGSGKTDPDVGGL